jgi:hypothetical protein
MPQLRGGGFWAHHREAGAVAVSLKFINLVNNRDSMTRVTLLAKTSKDKRHPLGEHTLLIGQLMALLNRARGTPLGPELTPRLAGGLDRFTRPQLDALTGFLRDIKDGPVRVLDFTTRQPIRLEDEWSEDGDVRTYHPKKGVLS